MFKTTQKEGAIDFAYRTVLSRIFDEEAVRIRRFFLLCDNGAVFL
jgi:hypothetical protein